MKFTTYSNLLLFCNAFTWIFFLFLVFTSKSNAQTYYGLSGGGGGDGHLYEITIDESQCGCDPSSCMCDAISIDTFYSSADANFCPNGNLYQIDGASLYQIDFTTGSYSFAYPIPIDVSVYGLSGLVCVENDLFYLTVSLINGPGYPQWLYRLNVVSGTFTNIGLLPSQMAGDMAMFQGDIYGGHWDLFKVDTTNPENSTTIDVNFWALGITASSQCNKLLGVHPTINTLYEIDILDETITPKCSLPEPLHWITSMQEFIPPDCSNLIDLDCNDSSGAQDADYNSPTDYDCFSDGAGIADEDIKIRFDAVISSMTIQVAGTIPDAPFEILDMTGSVPAINASGLGTNQITLTNAGSAKSMDFKDALHSIIYENLASPMTSGLRTVEVQFTTESGGMSNVATAFIQVNELPILDVDLGPDIDGCEGTSTTLDAGHPGANYLWSTGDQTQTITVDQSGLYIVTVDDGVLCPTRDTVELEIGPVIHISLVGDNGMCENEEATLSIITDTPFALDIVISSSPGSPISFSDMDDDFDFAVSPSSATVYTITSVIPSSSACIEILDPVQSIQIHPHYNLQEEVSLCDGDSIWLGYYWETEEGLFDIYFASQYGCDSLVNFNIDVLPVEEIHLASTTCDPASAGVFITYLDNPFGCDTVVETTVTLLASDTTSVSLSSCNSDSAGISMMLLTNQTGCDSLIITTVSVTPPEDTTSLSLTTCDSALVGVVYNATTGSDGCDSLVITTVTLAPVDTTLLFAESCDSALVGVVYNTTTGFDGCDSVVITTVSVGIPDTTLLFSTSCDSASLGVFEMHLVSSAGCDSVVFTTVSYSASDSTFIIDSSCDPDAAGVFIQNLVNRFGCDSIVTETISLLSSDAIFINSTSCEPADTGVFVQMLFNQNGCDSVVTETISLLPSDETFLFSTTCMSSEAGMFITTHFNQHGCDSLVTLTVYLVPADTAILFFNTCDPAQIGSIETLFIGQDGCDSLVIEATALYPLPVLSVQVSSDYNGYDISCFGESDGSATADVNGVSPFTYVWSTGDTDQTITSLAAGSYSVMITDGNGCITNGEILLVDPEPFEIGFIVSEPDCFDQQFGSISVEPVGGVAPYRFSIDGTNYQSSADFTGLSEGVYQITSLDANDCSTTEIIWINVPLLVQVELGDDQVVSIGDTTLLQAIVNIPFDSLASVMWVGMDSVNCPGCLTQLVAPIITTSYSISVTTIDGCADRDSLTLFVHEDNEIYVPNIFSPNGDNINDQLIISAGADVAEIESFVIFDRWGDMVFSSDHIQANDPTVSWDGSVNGKRLNPGVFTYKLVGLFNNGTRLVRYGDITLVR